MDNIARYLFCLLVTVLTLHAPMSAICAAADGGETGFEIRDFEVTGNSIFPADKLRDKVAPFTGPGKTAADVEKARDSLEKLYHDDGYPAVMVNIPEQTLKDGVVRLQVIESRIGRVKITGNRYFTMEKVMKNLPSLAPGEILYLPKVQKEIGRLNRSQDFKVDPVMSPGKVLGTIDVELRVEDRLPLHGYLELSNKASHNTKELRLNAMIRYDNLWQKEHSASLQYQTAPQDPKEVEVVGGSYVLPAPWEDDHQVALYGIWSDSATAFGEGFKVLGKGKIFGMRYAIPLQPYRLYAHNITLGLDYKHFNQAVGFTTASGQTTHTSISYLPLSFSYSGSLPDEWGGMTQFSGGVNMSMRGVGSDETEFELKRYKGTASYLYASAGIQRAQKLLLGMSLFVKADGQISDQPLIDNEQYTAGGMESVRGYMESEAAGDDAVHGTLEVSFSDPLERFEIGKWFQMSPFLFYDMAKLTIKEPLPGQSRGIKLEGAGAGIRGLMMKNLEYEMDWAVALHATDRIQRNDQRVYFKVKALF
ncbi:MAG: ShlB/FhaC/HecB family hemolysin secretion/activation protein [Deltaproteobacteria bacterium]|nr:ShlB/FhaC/HecB family hemolysin secretion/activation protein [Deltaproteobacteria bacterium]